MTQVSQLPLPPKPSHTCPRVITRYPPPFALCRIAAATPAILPPAVLGCGMSPLPRSNVAPTPDPHQPRCNRTGLERMPRNSIQPSPQSPYTSWGRFLGCFGSASSGTLFEMLSHISIPDWYENMIVPGLTGCAHCRRLPRAPARITTVLRRVQASVRTYAYAHRPYGLPLMAILITRAPSPMPPEHLTNLNGANTHPMMRIVVCWDRVGPDCSYCRDGRTWMCA